MTIPKFPLFLLAIAAVSIPIANAEMPSSAIPPTFLWDGKHLAQVKESWSKGEQTYAEEIAVVVKAADTELTHEPYTIVTRARTPGMNYDPHDYYSMGPYWWPNPNTSDGLPFVRKDGEVNPRSAYCRTDLNDFIRAVRNLVLAGYVTGDEKYTQRAVVFIRTWFLDKKTLMNPHLRFAQAVPGRSEGRGIGLIDTSSMRELVDAMQVLTLSSAWPEADQKGVKAWFDAFLRWFLDSKAGKDEAAEANNHGTWYREQVALYGAFTGQEALVKPFFDQSMVELMESQVEAGGRQPKELARTRAMNYCLFNLQAWEDIATLSPRYGHDYWNVETPIGARLKAGIDFMLPYTDPTSIWMQDKVERRGYWPMLAQAYAHYREKKYLEAMARLPDVPEDTEKMSWWRLVSAGK